MVNPDLKEVSESFDNGTSVTRRVKPHGPKNNEQDENSEIGIEGSIHLTESKQENNMNRSFY